MLLMLAPLALPFALFALFAGVMLAPRGWPAGVAVGLAVLLVGFYGAGILRLYGPSALVVMAGAVALAAGGQWLLHRPGSRRAPLMLGGVCLPGALAPLPLLTGAR